MKKLILIIGLVLLIFLIDRAFIPSKPQKQPNNSKSSAESKCLATGGAWGGANDLYCYCPSGSKFDPNQGCSRPPAPAPATANPAAGVKIYSTYDQVTTGWGNVKINKYYQEGDYFVIDALITNQSSFNQIWLNLFDTDFNGYNDNYRGNNLHYFKIDSKTPKYLIVWVNFPGIPQKNVKLAAITIGK